MLPDSALSRAVTHEDTVIDLGGHCITLRDHRSETKAADWLRANDVDPISIPLYQAIYAVDGRIRCRSIALDGHAIVLNENRDGWAETDVDVPMTKAPHEFGL